MHEHDTNARLSVRQFWTDSLPLPPMSGGIPAPSTVQGVSHE